MTRLRAHRTVSSDGQALPSEEIIVSKGTAKERLLHDPVAGKSGSKLGVLAGDFFQVAYVTPDLDKFAATFNEKLGVDRFYVIRDAQVTDQTYRGEPCDARQDLAFGYAGDLQFEIIQVLSGESTYSEFLGSHPEGGIHHTGVLVDDYDETVAQLSQSFSLAQTGRVGETRFGYFDTKPFIGAYVEVLQLGDDFVQLFEHLRTQDF
jgi:methylmalonyl-CoA/ethylmalonyl-CoA epimerase